MCREGARFKYLCIAHWAAQVEVEFRHFYSDWQEQVVGSKHAVGIVER